jgi:hypothetical protein
MGKAMAIVDKYTWVLNNLCSWVSTISQSQFYKVEKVLISVLLDSSSSPLTCMMVSDIWCFLARYGTSQLCLAHLTLLSSILQKLKLTTFSTPILFITILMERLTNFLSPTDQAIWQSRKVKPELEQLPALLAVFFWLPGQAGCGREGHLEEAGGGILQTCRQADQL